MLPLYNIKRKRCMGANKNVVRDPSEMDFTIPKVLLTPAYKVSV